MITTNAPATQRPTHRTLSRTVAALIALLISLGLSLATASAAQAHTWVSSGRPGQVQLKTVEIWAGNVGSTEFRAAQRYAWRSPATTGTQEVYMFVDVDRWDSTYRHWVNESSTYWVVRIPAGAQGAWLPATSVSPREYGAFNTYRVKTSFVWRVPSATTNLGIVATSASQSGDYWCSSNYCSITTAGGQVAAKVFV